MDDARIDPLLRDESEESAKDREEGTRLAFKDFINPDSFEWCQATYHSSLKFAVHLVRLVVVNERPLSEGYGLLRRGRPCCTHYIQEKRRPILSIIDAERGFFHVVLGSINGASSVRLITRNYFHRRLFGEDMQAALCKAIAQPVHQL